MRKEKNNFDRFFLLSWKKTAIGLIVWIASVVLHNLIYAFILEVLKMNIDDEGFFFIIATIIIPSYFITAIIYSLIARFRKK